MLGRLLAAHRATGADVPWGDPLPAHPGVAMEGYFWRFTLPDRVVVALCGVNEDGRGGRWATVGLAGHPGLVLGEAEVDGAHAQRDGLGCTAGDGAFVAADGRVSVDLGERFRLDAVVDDAFGWPFGRRAFGGSGPFHAVPALNQYWHPHVLGGRARGTAVLDGECVDLAGANVYAEKNWGRGGFPDSWWWGQAQGFAGRDDVCVALAGGEVVAGPLRGTVTSLVVRLGGEVLRFLTTRATVSDDRWSLRARTPLHEVVVEARAPLSEAHVLPVPLPRERRNVPGALEHLGGHLRLDVRRRGRTLFRGESPLAGLEHGGLARAQAEADRRART